MRTFTTSILTCLALVAAGCSDGSSGISAPPTWPVRPVPRRAAPRTRPAAPQPVLRELAAAPQPQGWAAPNRREPRASKPRGGRNGGMTSGGGSGVMPGRWQRRCRRFSTAGGLKQGPFKMLVLSHHARVRARLDSDLLQMLKDLSKTTDADFAKIGAPAGSTWTVDSAARFHSANYFFGDHCRKSQELRDCLFGQPDRPGLHQCAERRCEEADLPRLLDQRRLLGRPALRNRLREQQQMDVVPRQRQRRLVHRPRR